MEAHMKKMRKIDAAWLAGMIDGDGYFTCAVWERRAGASNRPSITIAPRIGVAQAYGQGEGIALAEHLTALTGMGSTYVKRELSSRLKSGRQVMWMVMRAEEIESLCKQILPFCIVKKRQCETMLELIRLRISAVLPLGFRSNSRTPIENTMRCAELGLSLNPLSTVGRNSQHNGKNRHWDYWRKRIPEIYSEAEQMTRAAHNSKRETLVCTQ